MFRKLKDPVSSLTHMSFAILAIPLTVIMIILAIKYGTVWHVVSFSIFGASLFLLYTASSVYHGVNISQKVSLILKKVDHMMIFVLIAGTYTPICLVTLRGAWGYSLLSVVWAMAIGGVLLKIFWIHAPRWFSTSIYVAMGWCVVIAFVPLLKSMPIGGVLLLAAGGITYTIGAVVYAFKWPPINFKSFGFHELFHVFVMGGSVFHVLLMFIFIL